MTHEPHDGPPAPAISMLRNDDFGSILVVCTRQIGDVLLTAPLIDAARRRWPQARIDVLGFAGTLNILDGHPAIRQVIEVEPGSGWLRSLGLIRRIWRRYDLALVAQRSDRAFLYGWVAARRRAALVMGNDRPERWKTFLTVHRVPVQKGLHVVVDKLALLQPWATSEATRSAGVTVTPPVALPLPPDLAATLRERYLVVHAPSMRRYKQWPVEHFRQLIGSLVADGHQVVLTGGGGQPDRECVDQLLAVGGPPALVDAAGRLSFGQLSTLLGGAALYIGPDTSITHLAAACSVPVIALFGPTPPSAWGPWPQQHRPSTPWSDRGPCQTIGSITLLQGPGGCVPCGAAGCDRHDDSRSACLEGLLPQTVLQRAREILQASSVTDA